MPVIVQVSDIVCVELEAKRSVRAEEAVAIKLLKVVLPEMS